MIEMRRYHKVFSVGETIGDVANMIVDAKALLKNDECSRLFARARDVDREAGRVLVTAHSKFSSSVLVRLIS